MRWPAALAIALTACGGKPGSVTGSVDSILYDMDSALVISTVNPDGSGSTSVYLSDNSNTCADGLSGMPLDNRQLSLLALGIVGESGLVVAPNVAGTFEIAPATVEPGSKLAAAETAAIGSCLTGAPIQATGGSVVVTHIELDDGGLPSRLVGSVDLDFADAGTLQGEFDSSACTGEFQANILVCN